MTDQSDVLLHSRPSAANGGTLVEITPAKAKWELIGFSVRRLGAGHVLKIHDTGQETCLVLLSGTCRVSWDGGETRLGPRENVFASYPHAAYLPAGVRCVVTAEEPTELADCRAPSKKTSLSPQIVTPKDCGYEIRGGGNATRQIIDILPPGFPADRLLICEVYTPGGNWSSYPPHKHDHDELPAEVRLEETYYFRFRDPLGYAFQRIYTADGRMDTTFKVQDGDLLLIREGYHPFVTAFGYDAYYLNVLAGNYRSMAARDDPRYAQFRKSWPAPDPRLPLVTPPLAVQQPS